MNRTKVNRKANKEIAKQAEARGINYCEIGLSGCLRTWFLQPAHRHKRRWYYDKPDKLLWDYKQWVVGCQKCHVEIEVDKELTEKIFLKLRGKEWNG